MGRVTRRARVRVAACSVAVLLVVGACSDDDAADPVDDAVGEVSHLPTTTPADTGGIDVPDVAGTFPIAVPAAGFGLALPDGWQATLLTDDALERLADARLARPSFLDAARAVAATGAVLYGAGVDTEERVAEVKLDVQDDADTAPAALVALAQDVVGSATEGEVVTTGLPEGWVRADYRFDAASADDGTPIEVRGSQFFVPDGDRLWSVILTSEDDATLAELIELVETTFVFDE